MAPPFPPEPDEEDAAAKYLKRMQGGDPPAAPPPAAPIRDARSGRMIPAQGSVPVPPVSSTGAQTARPHLPEAQGPLLSRGTPPEAPLPPGAPRVLIPSPNVAQAIPTAQPGSLPSSFMSKGVDMLRKGDYKQAIAFYEARAREAPEKADGWLGLGAAVFGSGDLRKGAQYMAKGAEIDNAFPVGALVVEARPGKPELLFSLAEKFMAIQQGPGFHCAMLTLDEVMTSPMTPEKLYIKADVLRRKARESLEWWEARNNPAMMSMKRNAAHQRRISSFIRLGFLAIILAGVAFGVHTFMNRSQIEALMRLGMDEYVEGARIEKYGQGKRASSGSAGSAKDMYQRAYEKFRDAAKLDPKSFDATYMMVEAGTDVLRFPPTDTGMQAAVRRARDLLRQLDPSGDKTKKKQADLKGRLEAI